MSSERSLWRTVKANLEPYGILLRIESSTVSGIADVTYCIAGHSGWIELKELDHWPKRITTTIKIPSLTLDQVLFLERWVSKGGAAHLLLQIARSYFLLTPVTVRAIWAGTVTRSDLEAQAVVTGQHHLPTLSIIRVLTRSNP